MAQYFKLSFAAMQYTITVYLLGFTLAQLLCGPLANRFGRRTVLLWALCATIIFSLLCGLSKPLNSFPLLLVSRFFAALSAGMGLTTTLTIISDVFTEKKAAQIVPLTALAFAVVPGLSIFIGGAITDYLGWVWCFYFLAVYYFIGLIVVFFLPETLKKGLEKKIEAKQVFRNYFKIVCDQRLLTYAIMAGLSNLIVYAYISIAPALTVDSLGIKASEYGVISLLAYIVYALGNLATAWMNKKTSPSG